jgi:hypothetical protein
MRRPDADSEVELPLGSEVHVDGREELLLLLAQRIKTIQRSVGGVVLQPARNLFGDVVAEFRVRRKRHPLIHARPVKRSVQRGIEREIPPPDFAVEDGADFPGPRVGRERGALVSKFSRKAYPHGPMPLFGHSHPRADVIAYPLPSAIRLDAGEKIKPDLRPVVDPLRDLHRLVFRMLGWQHAVDHHLAAFNGEVGMELDHRGMRSLRFRRVDLNFVVVLRASDREQSSKDENS